MALVLPPDRSDTVELIEADGRAHRVTSGSCNSSFFLHACKLLPSSIGVFVTCLVICRRVATTHNRCSMEVGTHSFTINFAKGKSARSAQLSPFTTSTTSVLVAEESGLPVVMHDFGPCRSKKKKEFDLLNFPLL